MSATPPERHYQEILKRDFNRVHYKSKSYFVDIEVKTKNDKRADVLFAFKRGTHGIYISVIEVKTRSTLGNLKLQNNETQKLYFALAASVIIFLSVFFTFKIELFLNTSLLVAFFAIYFVLVAAIIYYFSQSKSKLALSIPAITQLKKYPANEKWIAFAADTFDKDADFKTLCKYCRKDRIGLISVHANGTIKIILEPEPTEENNQYLYKYKRAKEIENHLRGKKKYQTPAEKTKTKKQLTLASIIFAVFIIALFFIVHTPEKGRNAQLLMDTAEFSIFEKDKRPKPKVPPTTDKSAENIVESIDCRGLQLTKPHFLVVETICDSETAAIRRIQELESFGLSKGKYIKSNCLNSDIPDQQYVVYISRLYDRFSKAEAKLMDLVAYLSKRNKVCRVCEILELEGE